MLIKTTKTNCNGQLHFFFQGKKTVKDLKTRMVTSTLQGVKAVCFTSLGVEDRGDYDHASVNDI